MCEEGDGDGRSKSRRGGGGGGGGGSWMLNCNGYPLGGEEERNEDEAR